MAIKNRTDLKSFFVKNAIPTEGNFADLIDSQLNQAQDGIFKIEGEPLSVVAAAGDQKRVLRLYANYPSANPDWMLSLNPAQDPANAATARAGLGITDGAGNTRLFVEAGSGRIGVGTNTPQFGLDVAGEVRANGFRGRNDLALNDYRTVNPASNVYLRSPGNDRDAWIYRDSAGTADNWGIYHRQIDGAIAGLPANSIAFIGGGSSKLQAYVNLGDGSGFFAGPLSVGGDVAIAGKHALRGNDSWLRLNQDGAFASGVHTPGNFSSTALNVGGVNSWGHPGAGNAWISGRLTAYGGVQASGNAGVLDLEGADHAYIQWFPMKASAGRKGWIGYGGANTTTMRVQNDAGALELGGQGVRVYGDLEIESSAGLGWARSTPDFNAPLRSGFYQQPDPAGDVPDTSHPWVHLIAVRHSNADNHHQLQIASTYSENNRLFFRKIARALTDGARPGWNEVAAITNGILRTDRLQLGDKWQLSGVGDHEANDEWLRMKNAANTAYHGGLAAFRLWCNEKHGALSDERVKTDISVMEGVLDRLLTIRGVRYKWKDASQSREPQIGLLAQEVEAVFPEVIALGPEGMKGIDYGRLVPPLIEAIRELRAEVQALRLSQAGRPA